MMVGESGLGKSTLLNTLFSAHITDCKSPKSVAEYASRQTTEIIAKNEWLEENGVRLKLTIVDTPGFGDFVNNENCWEPIVKYIKDQYALYLRRELTPSREKRIPDTRVHCVLYFIAPTGHSLKPLDIHVLRILSGITNVIPIIGKSDSLTSEEQIAFKRRIRNEIVMHQIKCYPLEQTPNANENNALTNFASEADRLEQQLTDGYREMIPFAVIGSEQNVVVEGKAVRGRRTRYGVINIEDESHCEFIHLRNFILRTHLQDLIETTSSIHYERFRTRQLLALKESTQTHQPQNQQSSTPVLSSQPLSQQQSNSSLPQIPNQNSSRK